MKYFNENNPTGEIYMSEIEAFYMPETIEEVQKLLREEGHTILGGGTNLSVSMPQNVKGLISLKKLRLNTIEECENSYKIGAQVVLSDIVKHQKLQVLWDGILCKAACNAGSSLNRNLITVGGNIVKVLYWSDLPPVLLLFEGNVIDDKNEKIPFETFFEKHPVSLQFGKERFVTFIELETPRNNTQYFWESFQKTKVDFAITTVCGALSLKENRIEEIKLSVGAISLLPRRLKKAEAMLQGKMIIDTVLMNAFDEEFKNFRLKYDYRVSKEYTLEITKNLFRKNIMQIKERDHEN